MEECKQPGGWEPNGVSRSDECPTEAPRVPSESPDAWKHALEESQAREREATALFAASRKALAERDAGKAVRHIFLACRDFLGARSGYAAFPKPGRPSTDSAQWECGTTPGTRELLSRAEVDVLRAEACHTSRAVYKNGLTPEAQPEGAMDSGAAFRNVLVAPAVADGKVLGFFAYSDKSGEFDGNDSRAAFLFAGLAAAALGGKADGGSPESPDTVRKSAPEEVAACREQLDFQQVLIDSVPIPIFYKDAEGRYLGCNKCFEEFTGRDRREIVGKTTHEVFFNEMADFYRQKDLELMQNPGIQVYETIVEGAQGELRDFVFHKATFTLPDGRVGGISGAMLDVSARKKTEELLKVYREHLENLTERRTQQLLDINRDLSREVEVRKRAERLLRNEHAFRKAVIERAAEGICVCRRIAEHPFVEFTLWNDRMTEITGRSMEEVNREGLALVTLPDTGDGRRTCEWVEETLGGSELRAVDLEIVHADGERRVLNLSTSSLVDEGGGVSVLALVHNITERVRAREQLQQRNQELEIVASTITAAAHDMNLQAILDHSLAGALELTGLEGGTLCLVDPGDRALILSAARNASPEMIDDLSSKRVQVGECLCGNAADTGEPLILWDNASGSEFATFEAVRGEGIRFHAAFPLQVRGRVTGVLCVFARSAYKPAERSLRLVKDLCNSIALTIENARLFESVQRELLERRKAESALRGEYAFRNAVIQNAAEGLCVCHFCVESPYIQFTVWNRRMKEITGRSMEEINRLGWYRAMYPEPEAMARMVDRMSRMRAGDHLRGECSEITRADGAIRVLRITTSFVPSAGGMTHVLAMMEDVTERQRAQDLQKRLTAILEASPDYVSTADVGGDIHYLNRGARRMLGYDDDEVPPSLRIEDTHPQWAADLVLREGIPTAMRDGVWHGEDALLDRNGREIPVSQVIVAHKAEDGSINFLSTVIRDMTERMRSETALRSSEARLRIMLETSPVPMVLSRVADGKIFYWNDRAREIIGVSPEEMAGMTTSEYYHDIRDRKAVIEELLRTGRISDREILFRRSDGTPFWCLVSAAVVDFDGERMLLAGLNDITERKAMEDSLRRQAQIIDQIHEAVITTDLGGIVIAWNKGAERLLGYREEEMLGRHASFLHGEGERASVEREIAVPLLEKGFHEVEAHIFRKSGEELYIHLSLAVLRNGQGDPVATIGSIVDITERKRMEDALRESEKRFRMLIENAPDAIFVQTNNCFAFVNEAAVKLFGASSAGQLLGRPIVGRVHPDYIDALRESIRRANEDREQMPGVERKYLKIDGTAFDVEVSSVPILYGDTNGALVFFRDITDRKRVEEELQKSRSMLQTVFDGISEPLIMMDEQGLVKMINKTAREYYGLPDDSVALGKTCYEGFRGQTRPCDGCIHPFSLMKGYAGGFERKGATDPERTELVVVYDVKDETGEKEATIVRVSDITQAKMMERQLVQSEKLASLGLLISAIAHEINNPNGFIVFNLPILKEYLQELMPVLDAYAAENPGYEVMTMPWDEFRKDIFKLLDNMEHGSRRINATVSRLKEFGRKQDRREKRWADLREMIERSVAICGGEIRKKVKTFETIIPDRIPPILTDPDAVEQIVVNLLINASHAANKDDSRISLRVSSEFGMQHRRVVIEIEDNGSGMDERTRARIFDPFFTTKQTTGTGLGLYVCRNLAESLNGSIEVDSAPGRGSTFRLILWSL